MLHLDAQWRVRAVGFRAQNPAATDSGCPRPILAATAAVVFSFKIDRILPLPFVAARTVSTSEDTGFTTVWCL